MSGPLAGLRVVELAAIGPAPFAAMVLADLGAEVVRVDRVDAVDTYDPAADTGIVLKRSRRSVAVDLKSPAGVETVLRLVDRADVLLEGFRPGVTERLGLGPDAVLARNPAVVYGRMTGWGQDGPWAAKAGHDINYIALAGVLSAIGEAGGPPVLPLNLVADFGGGGMLLAVGILAAVLEARRSGQGQVVDAAMVDGAALLASVFYTGRYGGAHRGETRLGGASHLYGVYETADGGHLAVGAIEAPFYAELLRRLGIDPDAAPHDAGPDQWPALKKLLADVIRTRTRDEWARTFEDADACVTPVLSIDEAPDHPHSRHRQAFVEVGGLRQPAPAPRFSRTAASRPEPPPRPGPDRTPRRS